MEFKFVLSRNNQHKFIQFSDHLYKGHKYYRDSMSEIIRMFLFKKTSFLSHGEFLPFIIEKAGQVVLRAAFIIDYKQPDKLLISFFEARQDFQDAFDLMLNKGRELAANRSLKKIIIGLDAHLNYGVGFLASHFDLPPSFGFGYSPEYYLHYFRGLKEHKFVSLLLDVDQFSFAKEQKILARIKKHGFTFRQADFRYLDREIYIFTRLNNQCYQGHLWWADRTFAEDKELFYPFRWFIKGANLLIAEKDKVPIGCLFWYPDYNQLLPPGKGLGVSTLIRHKLAWPKKVDRFKIADIAIRPEYQGTGVILGLFETLSTLVKGKYKFGECGWIAENNHRSRGFGIRWHHDGCEEFKQFKAFELEI